MGGGVEYCNRAVSRVDFIKMENRIGTAKRDVKYLGLFKNFSIVLDCMKKCRKCLEFSDMLVNF